MSIRPFFTLPPSALGLGLLMLLAPAAGAEDLSVPAKAAISDALGRDDARYAARVAVGAVTATRTIATGSTSNTAPDGPTIVSGAGSITLRLVGAGRGEALVPVGAARPRADANRVEYRRDGLSEWYANGPLGLQQGFPHRPATGRRGERAARAGDASSTARSRRGSTGGSWCSSRRTGDRSSAHTASRAQTRPGVRSRRGRRSRTGTCASRSTTAVPSTRSWSTPPSRRRGWRRPTARPTTSSASRSPSRATPSWWARRRTISGRTRTRAPPMSSCARPAAGAWERRPRSSSPPTARRTTSSASRSAISGDDVFVGSWNDDNVGLGRTGLGVRVHEAGREAGPASSTRRRG